MSIEKFNHRKRIYDYQIPENNFKGYAKLSDYSVGSVLPVFGFFISHSGRFGDSPIAISVYLDGKWRKLKIVDRMGSSSGKKIDVFWPGHKGCYQHGVIKSKTVYVR